MKKRFRSLLILAVLLSIVPICSAGEIQVIHGAGPSTAIVKVFIEQFSKLEQVKAYRFRVPEQSDKHAGGIRGSNDFIFGRTGRPLNEAEKALNKEEIFLARIPIAFAVGTAVNVSSLSLQEVKSIFTGAVVNWKDVGGPDAPILTVGREQKEALFSIMKKEYPFFEKANFSKIVKKDNAVINFLKHPRGQYGIGFGAKPNFQRASLSTVVVDDFSTGVSLGLVYDKQNSDHPLVKTAVEFSLSEEWANKVTSLGLLPPLR